MITVIGATNIDIIASTKTTFVPQDSNPSHIVMGIGGVAKNYAHNLSLLGESIQFITLFGADPFGDAAKNECKRLNFDTHLSATPKGGRSSMFICINNDEGHIEAGAADVSILEDNLTPEFLEKRMDDINHSDLVLFDANLPVAAIAYLLAHCTAPMMADGVSTKKASRIAEALFQVPQAHLHTLKLNRIEAEAIFAPQLGADLAAVAAQLHRMGVDYVYITDGSRGVFTYAPATDQPQQHHWQAMPPKVVVDTNGAGDAFISGLAYAFVHAVPYPRCVQYGLRASQATIEVPTIVNPNLKQELEQLQLQ